MVSVQNYKKLLYSSKMLYLCRPLPALIISANWKYVCTDLRCSEQCENKSIANLPLAVDTITRSLPVAVKVCWPMTAEAKAQSCCSAVENKLQPVNVKPTQSFQEAKQQRSSSCKVLPKKARDYLRGRGGSTQGWNIWNSFCNVCLLALAASLYACS